MNYLWSKVFRNAFRKERVPEFVPFVGTMNEELVQIFEEERNLEFVPHFLIFAIVPRSPFLFIFKYIFYLKAMKNEYQWCINSKKYLSVVLGTHGKMQMCVCFYIRSIFKVLFINYVVSNRFITLYVFR